MGTLEAILIGIVQGLTEFLPISSTAHIRVLPALLSWPDPGAAFTAVIQLGTLLAVLIYFRRELLHAFGAWFRSLHDRSARNTADARIGWGIFIGTIPIVVFGLAFKRSIERDLRSLYVVAGALILMGIVLALADRWGKRNRGEADARPIDGLWVGLFQAIALIPGASRSGSTIAGAMLCGFDRAAAARYSFLLSVPSVFAAAVLEVWSERTHLADLGWSAVLWANAAAFVVGYASIAFLIRWLQTRSLAPFIVYRILLGLALLGLMAQGTLAPDAGLSPEPPSVSSNPR
ncbi:MAG: undecaprenyl-diphosphatase UppP [Armatimonadetes bacterium]|jgi:undecaprenyl-diphosphatase|nr:undecaprenyl-diphosphatase UppP [Armatimonadota bacterium]